MCNNILRCMYLKSLSSKACSTLSSSRVYRHKITYICTCFPLIVRSGILNNALSIALSILFGTSREFGVVEFWGLCLTQRVVHSNSSRNSSPILDS
jgi:hypothetical protein